MRASSKPATAVASIRFTATSAAGPSGKRSAGTAGKRTEPGSGRAATSQWPAFTVTRSAANDRAVDHVMVGRGSGASSCAVMSGAKSVAVVRSSDAGLACSRWIASVCIGSCDERNVTDVCENQVGGTPRGPTVTGSAVMSANEKKLTDP